MRTKFSRGVKPKTWGLGIKNLKKISIGLSIAQYVEGQGSTDFVKVNLLQCQSFQSTL